MQNMTVTKKGDTLTIVVDLSKSLGPSKSGKTEMVATSEGNQRIDGTECYIGLNIYKKQ